MSTEAEKSGVHLTGADSGWPTGNVALEPEYTKDGTGADPFPDAEAAAGGVIVDDGTDEAQTVTITGAPAGGTFTVKLGAGGDPSDPIARAATAAAFKTALMASDDFDDDDDVTVTGSAGGPWGVTFGGQYSDTNVAQLQLGTNSLTGGTSPSVAFATVTPGAPL